MVSWTMAAGLERLVLASLSETCQLQSILAFQERAPFAQMLRFDKCKKQKRQSDRHRLATPIGESKDDVDATTIKG